MKTIKHIWNKWENLIASIILWLSKKTRYNVDNKKTGHFITHSNKSANFFQIFFNAVLKRKIMLFSILVILISLPVLYLSLRYQSKTEAAWYNDQWTYRQTVAITNSGSAQTDYQVSIGVGTSALIVSGKMQSDCDDIRVTDANGKVLPYWIESGTNGCNAAGNSTNVWTKVPSIPTSGATVYVYYGNASISSAQDGNAVFSFFDDFSESSINSTKWPDQTGTWTISSGTLYSSTADSAIHQTNISGSRVMEVRVKGATTGTLNRFGLANDNYTSYLDSAGRDGVFWHMWNSPVGSVYEDSKISGSGTQYQQGSYSADTYNIYKISLNIGSTANFYQDNTLKQAITSNVTSANLGVWLSNDGAVQTTYDWIFVRKYAATEPSVASPTNEEKTPGPVAYWKFDEGQGTSAKDSTINGQNQNFTNSPTWQTEDLCVTGKCLKFATDSDYTSYTVSATSPMNLGTSNFTVSHWQKVFQPVTYGSGIIGRYPHNTDYNGNFSTGISDDLTTYFFMHRDMAGSAESYGINYSSYFGKWVYVTWVRSGSTISLYIDGVLKQSWTPSITFNVSFSGVPFFISQTGWSPGAMSNLMIDDLKMYNYARSAAQIKTDYASRGSVKGTSASMGSNSKNSDAFSKGLVGYWKLDETSSPALDSSGVGNTLASTGVGATFVSGKYGNAGQMDTTAYFNNSGCNVMDDNETTWSAWVWIDSTATDNRAILRSNSYHLSTNGSSKYILYINDSSGGWTGGWTSTASISTDTWQHVALTYSNRTMKFYINGQLDSTNTYSSGTGLPASSTSCQIGAAGGWNNFKGKVDEARVYNRALSPKEVRDLYNWAPGPVGYWKMDDKVSGDSKTIVDTSTIGNNASTVDGANNTGIDCTQNGKYGGACELDGIDDYIADTSFSGLTDSPLTMEAWVYPTALQDSLIIEYGTSGGSSDFFIDILSSTQKWRYVKNGIGSVNSNSTVVLNKWTHVAVVENPANSVKLYINGVLENSGTITLSHSGGSNSIYIGARGGGQMYFKGKIDDVQVYNYGRTEKQIIEDMNAGHPAVGSPVGSALGHWKFDEGYGTTANNSGSQRSTLNGTLGTGSSAPSWSNNGKFGKALSFGSDGDFVNIGNNLPTMTEGTIAAWFNRTASTGTYQMIFTDSTSQFEVTFSSNTLQFYVDNTAVTVSNSTLNSWQHVVGTFSQSGNFQRLYLDGKLVASGAYTGDATAATRYIGSRNAQYPFIGSIDEVKVYNYALTEDEIKLDYNRGSAMVLGTLSVNTGNTAPPSASSQEYCVPGDSASCASPAGEWTLNEGVGSTAYDISGNGNVGYWNGTGSHWANGKIGKSGNFNNSDDYISIADASSLNLTASFTFEAWIKRGATGVTQGIYDSGTQGNHWGIALYQDKIDFVEDDIADNVSTSTIDTNWHHIAVVKSGDSGTNLTFYLDGKQDGTASVGTVTTPSGTKNIGRWDGTAYANGKIDHVRIYNYARTPSQIAWDYNRGAPVGWWKLDESQGSIVYDSSGVGNTGTITIGASGSQTSAGTITTASTAWYNGATGKYNYSLNFDGTDDYTEVGSNSMISGTGAKTVSLWMYPGSTQGRQDLISTGGCSTGTMFNILYDQTNEGIYFGGYARDLDGNTNTITRSAWNHVVIVYDGNTAISMYINGVLNKSGTLGGTLNISSSALRIGRGLACDGASAFTGQIDDVRVYNYALTAGQVTNLYNGGAALRFGPSTGAP